MTETNSDTALFNAIREILIARTGKGLTTDEVQKINRALGRTVVEAVRSGMRASSGAVALIHSFEQCKLQAYRDPGSVNGLPITIGWGSTRGLDGKPIQMGTVWTQAQADAAFARDLAEVETGVNMLIGKAPTTQSQFDALVSFAYNVGLDIDDDTKAEGLGDSTLLKRHLAGDYAGAQAQFGKWINNDGKPMNGLIRRRKAEAELYGAG